MVDDWEGTVGIVFEFFHSYAASESATQFTRMIEEIRLALEVGHTAMIGKGTRILLWHDFAHILPWSERLLAHGISNVLRHSTCCIDHIIVLATLHEPRSLCVAIFIFSGRITLLHVRRTESLLSHHDSAHFTLFINGSLSIYTSLEADHIFIQFGIVKMWITPIEISLTILIHPNRWIDIIPFSIIEKRFAQRILEHVVAALADIILVVAVLGAGGRLGRHLRHVVAQRGNVLHILCSRQVFSGGGVRHLCRIGGGAHLRAGGGGLHRGGDAVVQRHILFPRRAAAVGAGEPDMRALAVPAPRYAQALVRIFVPQLLLDPAVFLDHILTALIAEIGAAIRAGPVRIIAARGAGSGDGISLDQRLSVSLGGDILLGLCPAALTAGIGRFALFRAGSRLRHLAGIPRVRFLVHDGAAAVHVPVVVLVALPRRRYIVALVVFILERAALAALHLMLLTVLRVILLHYHLPVMGLLGVRLLLMADRALVPVVVLVLAPLAAITVAVSRSLHALLVGGLAAIGILKHRAADGALPVGHIAARGAGSSLLGHRLQRVGRLGDDHLVRRRLLTRSAVNVSIIMLAGIAKPVGLLALLRAAHGLVRLISQLPMLHCHLAESGISAVVGGHGDGGLAGAAGGVVQRLHLAVFVHGDLLTVGSPLHRPGGGSLRDHRGGQLLLLSLGQLQRGLVQRHAGDGNVRVLAAARNRDRAGGDGGRYRVAIHCTDLHRGIFHINGKYLTARDGIKHFERQIRQSTCLRSIFICIAGKHTVFFTIDLCISQYAISTNIAGGNQLLQ